MGKSKKASKEDKNKSKDDSTLVKESDDRPEYEVLITQVNAIAKPLATKKLTKKLYKTVKKGTSAKYIYMPYL